MLERLPVLCQHTTCEGGKEDTITGAAAAQARFAVLRDGKDPPSRVEAIDALLPWSFLLCSQGAARQLHELKTALLSKAGGSTRRKAGSSSATGSTPAAKAARGKKEAAKAADDDLTDLLVSGMHLARNILGLWFDELVLLVLLFLLL